MGKRGDSKSSEQSGKGTAENKGLPSPDGPMGCSNWTEAEAAAESGGRERAGSGGEDETEDCCKEATWLDSECT